MKKVVFGILVIFVLILYFSLKENKRVDVTNETLGVSFLAKNIPIIDIRTKKEWEETGIVPNSHLITFYTVENNRYIAHPESFLKSLEKVVSKDDTFGLICRSGNRTNRVTRYLHSLGYTNVINLMGGIKMAKKNNIKLVKP